MAALADRPESIRARAMAREGGNIPGSLRDLLSVLDLWCDLSATVGHHLRDGAHDLSGGRYGLVLRGGDILAPALLGPLCDECVVVATRLALEWKQGYNRHEDGAVPFMVDGLPWCEAVRRVRG